MLLVVKMFVVVTCIAFWIDLFIAITRYMNRRRDQYSIRRRRSGRGGRGRQQD